MSQPSLLQLVGICKRFPGVIALNNVSLTLEAGEVVALIGENGAGKSTLMKALGGVHQPEEGEIRIEGAAVTIRSVTESVKLGIGFVHQELNNLPNLDVAANIYLGREPLSWGPLKLVNRAKMARESKPYLERLGLDVSPRTLLEKLSVAQQQVVEIAKALSQNARILILDEPTSSLTQSETERLLATVLDLKANGVSVLYVSHRLGEIRRIADRVVALRDGQNAGELKGEEITHDKMVRMMVGRDVKSFYAPPAKAPVGERLRAKDVRTTYRPTRAVSFSVASGEILGFAGLVGAGRSELMKTIFGIDSKLGGEIFLDNKPLRVRSARDAINAGIFLVPEDRRGTGLVVEMSIRENITLPGLWQCSNAMALISRAKENETARQQIAALRVKASSSETAVLTLSGGNQQKVALGKWLALKPSVLIVDEPTRGIDVGAKAEIYRLLRQLADAGVAIIAVSSDLEEILNISDRIAVMHEGSITGILNRDQFSEEAVMNLAFGKAMSA